MKEGTRNYEADIVDKLFAYEKEGKGKLKELCTVQVGGRRLPFVAFVTGSDVVVTARHHINEFWGTTETVMKLAESGQEGLTLVPVVDVEYYEYSEARKKVFLDAKDGWGSALMYDMYHGYKDGPQTHAKNQWGDYMYDRDVSPPHIKAIKGLIDSSDLYVDIHNSAVRDFFFLTVLSNNAPPPMSFQGLAAQVEAAGQKASERLPGQSYKKPLYPGVFPFDGKGTAINYAANRGKLNIGIEIPVFDPNAYQPGKWHELTNIGEMADITAGTISMLRRNMSFSSSSRSAA